MDLKKLAEPFPATDIEWRIQSSGMSDTKGPWAKVLAYVTNRAIMERLDEVCGPENWQNDYKPWTTGAPGVMCGIAVQIKGTWVWKWDGSEQPKEKSEGQLVAVKGGFSMSMKRAGVQWGIGRYLYNLTEGWAAIGPEGEHYVPKNDKKGTPPFRWNQPKLPSWALPGFTETKAAAPAKVEKPKRDIVADGIARAGTVEVRGKALADHTTDELAEMQLALRAEGSTKHKDLLGSIILVLSDRPEEDVNVARMNASEDKQQGGLTRVMAGSTG